MSLHRRTQNQTHRHQTESVHHFPISPTVSTISSRFLRRFWWHSVIVVFLRHFYIILGHIHCNSWSYKLQKEKNLKFLKTENRPPICKIGHRFLLQFWAKVSVKIGHRFWSTVADFELFINIKEMFLNRRFKSFWRLKGTKTHRKRSGAQLKEIHQEKFMNYSCNLSFTLSFCLISMCN